ncbi:hypothetical protein MKY19_21740 [Paenibacillus sp. FSL R5-0744]|uniref:hypothetical protein n=1 Tax=Paenibacillus sp. FSL R5-0744 TaxID=2921656 RepID=UPI0030DD2D94
MKPKLSFSQRFLFTLAIFLIIYGVCVSMFEIPVPKEVASFISICSFVFSLFAYIWDTFKNAVRVSYKVIFFLLFIVTGVFAIFVPALLVIELQKPAPNPKIDILSNYSTIVAFGIFLLALIFADKKEVKKKQTYVSSNMKITKKKF